MADVVQFYDEGVLQTVEVAEEDAVVVFASTGSTALVEEPADPDSVVVIVTEGSTEVVETVPSDHVVMVATEPETVVVAFESGEEVIVFTSGGPPGADGPPGPPGEGQVDLDAHIFAPLPHPAYDDIQDLTLLFNNGLV